ncbi:MAG: hypothetical protein IKK75_02965 [Clostridia bacterium]|nr:hypothetical protein [Clostridia bacterium]
MANLVITFIDEEKKQSHDLEVPDEITADELVSALQTAYHLRSRLLDSSSQYMRMEFPIGLIKGKNTLKELGMRNGSIIYSGKEAAPDGRK